MASSGEKQACMYTNTSHAIQFIDFNKNTQHKHILWHSEKFMTLNKQNKHEKSHAFACILVSEWFTIRFLCVFVGASGFWGRHTQSVGFGDFWDDCAWCL